MRLGKWNVGQRGFTSLSYFDLLGIKRTRSVRLIRNADTSTATSSINHAENPKNFGMQTMLCQETFDL